MNVLIIDDEYYARKALLKSIGDCLKKHNVAFSLFECSSAEEAILFIDKNKVELLFTDVRMSEIDGVELCAYINKKFPQIRLVIISGYADFSYAQRAMKYGVYRYLTKPIDEKDIDDIIIDLLAKKITINHNASTVTLDSNIETKNQRSINEQSIVLDPFAKKLFLYYLSINKLTQAQNMIKEYIYSLIPKSESINYAMISLEIAQLIQTCAKKMKIDIDIDIDINALTSIEDSTSSILFINKIINNLSIHSSNLHSDEDNPVDRIRSYIDENYSENISLYDIAQNVFYMHPNYISRLLKNDTGKSFSKYLLDVRMRHAKNLLEKNSVSIAAISQMIGYSSESHFVQMFKQYYGFTPGTYKKNK